MFLFCFIGMFLSEFMSWNMGLLQKAMDKGPIAVLLLIFAVNIAYIFILGCFYQFIVFYNISDIFGLLLTGSIFGLILEGIFAKTILYASNMFIGFLFPALSWAVLITFTSSFYIHNKIISGESLFSKRSFCLISGILLGIIWMALSHAKWVFTNIPSGVTPKMAEIIFIYSSIHFAILLWLSSKSKSSFLKRPFITKNTLYINIIIIVIFSIIRLATFPIISRSIIFLIVLSFYSILLMIHIGHKKNACHESVSISISLSSYLIFVFSILSGAVFFEKILYPFFTSINIPNLSVLPVLAGFIFALLFPIYAIFNSFKKRKMYS